MFPLEECVMIETVDDDALEGNHDFSVRVDRISPDGVVTANWESFTVTITDAADGGLPNILYT